MQAIILATGEEEKLLPLTSTLPTPMVPIANQPVMTYSVELLSRLGIKKILVSLHHLSGSIESYFSEGRRWGVQFEYILQKDPLGNAGSLRWALSNIDETLIVFPGDRLIDIDLDAAIKQHKQSGASATILVSRENIANSDITLFQNDQGNLSQHQTDNRCYSSGFFILEPEVIKLIPQRQKYHIEADLIPLLLSQNQKIHLIETEHYWNPLISFNQYDEAQTKYLDSAIATHNHEQDSLRYPSMDGVRMGDKVWAGRHNMIHPTVRIFPPVTIGDYCQIGRDVVLGPYAIIGSNVIIDDEASVVQSTVISNTYIGQLVNIENRFISRNMMVDTETSESLEIVDRFLIGEANPSLVNSDFRRFVDGAAAIILCVLLFPLFAVIGLLAVLTSGRLFDRVPRVGVLPRTLAIGGQRDPVQFELLNFSTQRRGKETRFGRWLKRSNLNRLPELISVADGTIGMIGVKPLTSAEAEQITEEWQHKRFEYMSGFTGLWYTQNSDRSSLDEIVISDVYYVATRTWRDDLKIVSRTPGQWWRRLTSSQST